MKTNLKSKWLLARFAPLALCVALAACGGSGAGKYEGPTSLNGAPTTTTDPVTGAPVSNVAKVTLFGDSPTLSTAKDKPISISAIVTSADNLAVVDKNVTFSVSDPVVSAGTSLVVESAKTDKSGTATATLTLLNDLTERDVKVTARYADAAPAEFIVRVAGNTIVASGPAQLPLNGEPSQYTIALKDGAGKPIVNQAVTIASKSGNPVTPAVGKTDAGGQATFAVKGSIAGDDVITASALGVSGVRSIKVSGESLNVAVGDPVIAIGTDALVTVTYASSAAVAPGTLVSLTTTAGQVQAAGTLPFVGASSASAPISNGSATFNLRNSSTGPATVSALINGTVSSTTVNFVSVTPSTISVQPSPAILGPNLGIETSQRSQLTATVRDAAGNPVANTTVTFNAQENPSGGRIEPALAITDFSGTATVSYISGPNTSPPNGVKIVASIAETNLKSSPSALSVSQQSLFLRMGTDNLVRANDEQLSYEKRYRVTVTDSTSKGVVNAEVQAKLNPSQYRTGFWSVQTVGPVGSTERRWVQTITATLASEDLDRDGQCTSAEDINSDGALTPGNVASVSVDGPTKSDGSAIITVVYPKNFAEWTELQLEVTTKVGGSEGRSATIIWLPIPADAVTNITVPPPGTTSPFPYDNLRPGVKCGQ